MRPCWCGVAIGAVIPVILHLYLGFNGIISCISRIVDFIENVYHIRVWKLYQNAPISLMVLFTIKQQAQTNQQML